MDKETTIPTTSYSEDELQLNEFCQKLPPASLNRKGYCEYDEDCLCFDFGFACCQ